MEDFQVLFNTIKYVCDYVNNLNMTDKYECRNPKIFLNKFYTPANTVYMNSSVLTMLPPRAKDK